MDKKIIYHFQKSDVVLYNALLKIKPLEPIHKSTNFFSDLCEAIINQQLSEKAGDTIFKRFKKLFPKGKITAIKLSSIPDKKIRQIGTSNAKVKFIKGLAQIIVDKKIDLARLGKLTDEEVIKELVKVKGVGPWTAEMFLMFSLAREDVFSFGDLGLQKAVQKLYKLKKLPSKKQLEKISHKWSPYRTFAARILWRSLEIT